MSPHTPPTSTTPVAPSTATPNAASSTSGTPHRSRRVLRTTALAGLCATLAAGATLIPDAGSPSSQLVAAGPMTAQAVPTGFSSSDLLRAAAAAETSRSATRGPAPKAATADESAALPAGEASGTRYARMAVNVRTEPDAGSKAVDVLAEGAKVTITQNSVDGWQQVLHEGRERWVKASLLSREKPAPSKPAASRAGASGSISSAPCPSGSGMERGLTANAIKVHRAVCHRFPQVANYGGNRADASSNHSSGHAVDVMVTGALGDQIAAWLKANAGRLGVTELIWEQRIWTTQRAGDGWRSMPDRGSATANHYDHVHVSVR